MTMYTKTGSTWSQTRDFRVLHGGAFRRVQKAWVSDADGSWREFYTYSPTIDSEISTSTSTTTVTDGTVTISGRVNEVGKNTSTPPAGSAVGLFNGSTRLLTTTTSSNGTYTFSWSPSAPGSYSNLSVRFEENGYWQPSTRAVATITVRTSTSVTASYPSYGVMGTDFVVSGTVKSTLTGTPAGTMYLEVSDGSAWSVGASGPISGGSYSLSWTPSHNWLGKRTIRLRYGGSGNYLSSSTQAVRTIYQPVPEAPSQTVASVTNNSLTLRISDRVGVDRYVTTCIETGNSIISKSTGVAGASITTSWGLRQDTSYTFKVVAHSNNPVKGSTSGNTIYVTTGHAAQTDKGSGAFTFVPSSTGSWRSVDGWSYLGKDLAQGYYTASYGAYTGLATFDLPAMRTRIDNHGTPRANRWQNASCTKFEVFATRVAAGMNAAQPIGWYISPRAAGSGTTAPERLSGTTSTPSGLAVGTSGWMTLGDPRYGDWLLSPSNASRSVAMYDSGSARYSRYSGGSNFKIRVTYTWNWTPVPYVAPTWRSS